MLEREIDPHVPLLAEEHPEEVLNRKRCTFNLERKRARDRKVKEARTRNRVRGIHTTQGSQVSRKLRIRGECADQQAKLLAVVHNPRRLVPFVGRRGPGTAVAAPLVPSCPRSWRTVAYICRWLAHMGMRVSKFVWTLAGTKPHPHLDALQLRVWGS